MIKFVFNQKQKGLFKALGLHHALITILSISIGFFINPILGIILAVFFPGIYFGREYKEMEIRSNNEFEVMDFVSPTIVGFIYGIIITNSSFY